MTKHIPLEAAVRKVLQPKYSFQKQPVGEDAKRTAKGITLETDVYQVADLGHLCVLRMKGFLGLLKMETVVLAVSEKDVPLLNLDWVRAFGKETQVVEFYDPTGGERTGDWISAWRLENSYKDSGRNRTTCYNQVVSDYLSGFAEQIERADASDPAQKKEKIQLFAETLYQQAGPAVNQIRKLFGEEAAKRLVLHEMYGVDYKERDE